MGHAHEHHQHPHHDHDRSRRGGFGPEFGGPGGPGGFGGPGPGFGGPRGGRGRGFGGPGGPGGRRRRGDVRLGLLLLLKLDGPANGYQLIQGLAAKSEGNWTPSPGSVYPTLAVLQDEGLISGTQTEGESGTTFALTAQGNAYIDGLGEIKAPWEDGPDKDHPAFQFRHAAGGAMKAAWQVAQDGNPDKITKAVEILAQARKDLYRLLAEDDA
jgi:DNA-binding PadR family transcriptional regulator